MGDSGKFNDLLLGAGSALLAELASYSIRSFWPRRKDVETWKYKLWLKSEIRLARATIEELPEGQTIKNEHVKAWMSDLIEAADEGDITLQSSTADAEALKNAFTKLGLLMKDEEKYQTLLKSEKNKAELRAAIAARAAARAGAAAPINPETLIAPGCTNYPRPLERFGNSRLGLFSAGAAGNPETLIGGTMYYSHPLEQFGFPKLEKKETFNYYAAVVAATAAASGNPERLIAPGGTINYRYPLEPYAFPKLENKEPLYYAAGAGAGEPEISLSINPSRRPCVSSEDHHYLNKKRMSSESSYGPTILEMVNPTASKKRRVLGDSLGEELEKNSSWLYDIDSTGRALTFIGEQSINDRMKMKGKCLEGELDEETGHGKANTPALSCSPSSSYGGAGDNIPPSCDGTPEDNDA